MQEVPIIIIITEQHRYRLCLKSHNAEWPFTRRASPNAKRSNRAICKQREAVNSGLNTLITRQDIVKHGKI